jgi:hypothetical protein
MLSIRDAAEVKFWPPAGVSAGASVGVCKLAAGLYGNKNRTVMDPLYTIHEHGRIFYIPVQIHTLIPNSISELRKGQKTKYVQRQNATTNDISFILC